MNDDIKKMLRIIDKNLEITKVFYETYRKQNTLVIESKLVPEIACCKYCGSTVLDDEGKYIVVKNGKKKVTGRMNDYNNLPTILKIEKQRFFCRNCSTSWTAQTYFIKEKQTISLQIKNKIIQLLKEKISMKLIAKLCNVSITTVIRVLKELGSYLPNKKQSIKRLPKVLMVDEFRSHTRLEDKMSFICADGKTGKLIDILPSRKLNKLTHYFNQYENKEEVKFLVTDMNASYFQLLKTCFPNAQLIIDRFHIIKHFNQALQSLRIREMNRLKKEKNNEAYNKLKANWKVITKNRADINHFEYKNWRSFRAPKYPYLTEAMMVDRLLSYSPSLKEAYTIFHDLTDAFRQKDSDCFFELLENIPLSADEEFRMKLQNLLKYHDGIKNAMKYPYSNGKIEAKNTHIKTLKRVSYGFKSFENMKLRIFMINNLIEIK